MPIFLVVILVLGGVVYAVPSFRAKFTGFLKYFGPKAETGCTTLECTNALISSSATPTTAPPSPDENDWQCGYSPNNGRNNSRNINKEFKNYRFDKVLIGGWIINTYRFLYPACQAGVTPEQYIRSGVAYPCTVSGGYENSEETVSQFTYFPQDLVQIDNIDILEKNKCQILIKNSETYSLKISSDGGTQSVIPERMPRMPQGSLLEHDHVGDQINFKFSQSGLYDILATFFNQAQIGVKINATKLGFKLNDVTQANQAQEITLGQNSSTVRPIQNLGSANYTNTDYKEFGADRPNRNEYHMGIDIDAPEGTPVKAIADGEIVGYTDFYRGTKMIIVKHALNGQVYYAGYGEVKSGSLESSGINGTPTQNSPIHISAGQVIGKIGNVGGEETMLHFELYSEYPGREVWMANGQKPSWLVDPTAILNQVYQTDSDIFTINAHEEKILNLQRVITSQFTLDGSTETKFFGATDYRNGEFNTYLHSNRSLGGTKVKLKYLSNEHPDVYLLSTPHTSITDLTGQTHTNLNQLNRNDMSLTETADFKLSPDQYKEIPFSNQEAFIKIKAKSAGKFKLIFDDTANTNIGPGEQYKEFFKRTLTVNVEASPYSFQNLSVCQQSQGGCTEVTGDPKSINPDETYKLKAKLVKMNNNVAEPLANKQVKIAIISGEGKVKSEASDNNLFDNSSSTYTTNSSGEISIPFKNKTAGDLKLNLVYQSNNQNLAESNINLSIKPKYSLSVELKDVTSSNELLRELVTDGNLFNEGIYQLKTKLTVANSTNADYLKDKTIELKQTDGIGKLKTVDENEDISSNPFRLITNSQGEASIKVTKKEDLQNVASPWPVKLNLALAESDVKKDLDLKINVLNITLKSCPITMQDGQNSVAFGIIPRVLAAGIENGGTCNYETLIPSPENPLLQPIPSEATVQSVMARIAQQSQSPTDNFFHGDQSDIASGDATIEINNFKNLFLDSSTNNISRLPDMELKIKLPLSLSQGEINQIVGNYKIGSALVESLRAYSLVSSGQQYQLPEKLDIPLKFGINGSEVNIRMIGVVGRNEHNQIIASFPLQASYKIDVISGDKFSITVGGNYIGRSATCVANMSWNIFSGSNASGRFTASYDPISGIHNEMLEVSLFTGGNSGQSSTPTPSQNTGGIIVDSLPDINYELTLGDDPNNIIEGIFKTKDIFDAMRRSHLPDMQQPSQNNGPVQPRSFDSTQNNPNINNNINITDPLGGRSDLGNLFPRDSMGNIFVVSSDLGKNKPDIYFISDSSNDVLAVNQNDLRQGNVQNLVLEPQFNKAAAPSDPQKLIAGVKPALDQKNSQDFCDPNLFDCSIYQNKNRLYPVVPVLTKSVESLTTGEKKNYQEQYLNYVGEYNTKQSQEISYINQKFAANSLRTSERTQSKEKYYQDLGKNNLVNAQANLDKFFAGKNVAGNTLYSLKTEIENNTQSILTNRNQQEDYIEKNSVGNDKQTELADLTRKFNNNIQELENKYSQKTGNTEEVTKIINTQITKSAQKPSPAVESKGFLQKTWDKLKNFMKIGKAGAQDKSLEVEINNPADEKLVSYQAGNNLKFSVKGLKNSEYYEVYLDKQFLAQGKKITNDFSFEVTIPQEAKTGNHKIVFIGNVSGEQTEKNIDIIASAANLSIYYPIGLGLLMAILAIILIFRYKKQAS